MAITMRGKKLDMAHLAAANAHKSALGNAGMNARGDKIDSQGTVLRAYEDMKHEYNETNPKAVRQFGLNKLNPDTFASPAEAVAHARKAVQNQKANAEKSKRRIADSE